MPETPEIIRKRKRNMERNANFRTNLDAGFSGSLFPRGGGGEPTPAATSTTSGVGQPLRVLEEEAGGGEGEGLVPLCELMKQWPGRGEQIVELAQLVGEADDGVPVPTILVTGPPCCGKTGVVTGLLENRGCSYVYVNCSEIFSLRGLMEAVLEQVAGGSRESILEARRVSRRFGEAQGDAAIFVEEADWLPKEEPDADNPEGADVEEVLEEGGDSRRQSGARQRLSCSTWNVFFRQLLALLACRSQQHQRRHQQQQQQQQQKQEQQHHQQQQQQQLPSFPPKLFFVFDNVEALLTESTAGVGVGAGGGGSWRGAQLVDKLARISDMVSGYTGFAAAGGGIGGSGIGGSGSGISGGGGGGGGGGGDGGAAITATLPSLPPVCPILISLNPFFASEVMGGMGGGGGKGGARGGVGSLLARACPLQLRFPLYSPKDLPDVVAATAHSFGVDLDADLGNISSNLNLGEATLGGRGSASGAGGGGSRGVEEGGGDKGRKSRKLFRKLAAALVQGLRSETWDAWELGNEAARLWPAYLKMAEDGYEDSELVAGLKPLLRETSKRLHGDEDDRGSGGGSGGALGGGAAASLSASGQGSVAGTRAGTGKKHELGLSRNGKTLLVAAYLASHNSRDTDRDVFTAKSTRAGRSMRRGAKVGNAGNLVEAGVKDLAEAQEFQLERLLSIVSSLVAVTSATNAGTKAANSMGSADLFLQIKSLTRLNLMRESRPGQLKTFDLDSPSYRCNISRELAQSVAEDIGITLSQYLVAN